MDCLICAENFTIGEKTVNKCVSCPYCSFSACLTCCKTYILDQGDNVCMNMTKKPDGVFECRKQWSRKFIVDMFPDNWIKNEWRQMTEKVGFEKEKALLPATMPEFERQKQETIVRQELSLLEKQRIKIVRREKELRAKLTPLLATNMQSTTTTTSRACSDESCRGYLSSQWKCGACDKWTCHQCNQIKGFTRDAEHTCNPDDIATATLLRDDTKPCPTCSVPIHKLVGCDQMWCTQCHTGFSWRTGRIEQNIHNPHYYEWRRQTGNNDRNPGDFECNRNIADYHNVELLRRYVQTYANSLENNTNKSYLLSAYSKIESIVRKTVHLANYEIRSFRTNTVVNNQDLRIKYLGKQISEKVFKSMILRRDKAFIKKQDIHNVLQLQIQGVTDILYRFLDQLKELDRTSMHGKLQLGSLTAELCIQFETEVGNLATYSNELLNDHANTYGCKKYQIDYTLPVYSKGGTRNPTLI
jgi:hypothetical protein|uniref:RING-type domain-containing protein n=1 Tax=viral metagenome TaxID=1070528 RepID=A0A6C0IQ28_9ZZZZ